jgi:hypothetical protein
MGRLFSGLFLTGLATADLENQRFVDGTRKMSV